MVTTLFRGAQLVPMDGPDDAPCGAITVADVRVDGDRITTIAPVAHEHLVTS